MLLQFPRHYRHGGNAIERCAFDDFAADGEVDQSIMFLVPQLGNVGRFEKQRGAFGKDNFSRGHFCGQGDGSRLPTGQGKLGRVFRHTQPSRNAPRARLTDVASDTRNLWIVEGINTNFVTGTKQLPRGGDAADLLRQHWGAEPGKCQGSQAKGIEEPPPNDHVGGIDTPSHEKFYNRGSGF